ncbi:MAG: hypothetical protein NC412_01425 [Roseburia sp.]|nr:hypothetical protein [Roseburia sp.]MCM1277734.1 hypothetical protein [Robinsoniella sp.]
MSLLEELKDLGVDVEEGLERVMDDQPLYETMLGMFIEKVETNPIKMEDFAADNLETLTGRVHMLKGLTGNLAMTPLFTEYMQMLELLRTGRPKEAGKEYEQILPIQVAIVDCIKRHISV